jgi:hypothetical protein
MKPLHYGILFVGGFLVLIGVVAANSGEEEEIPEQKPKSLNESSDQVNVEEIRRLRRELRQQLAKKKKNTPTNRTS